MLSVVRSRSRVRKPLLIWTLLAPRIYKFVPPPENPGSRNPSPAPSPPPDTSGSDRTCPRRRRRPSAPLHPSLRRRLPRLPRWRPRLPRSPPVAASLPWEPRPAAPPQPVARAVPRPGRRAPPPPRRRSGRPPPPRRRQHPPPFAAASARRWPRSGLRAARSRLPGLPPSPSAPPSSPTPASGPAILVLELLQYLPDPIQIQIHFGGCPRF